MAASLGLLRRLCSRGLLRSSPLRPGRRFHVGWCPPAGTVQFGTCPRDEVQLIVVVVVDLGAHPHSGTGSGQHLG